MQQVVKIETVEAAIAALHSLAKEENRQGMARFGINIEFVLGVSMPDIRKTAKSMTKNHDLALNLWKSGIHEARILASLVDKPQWVTSDQMEAWVADFNSWDLCDQVCGNLFDRCEFTEEKIRQWVKREEEYIRRAGFVMIAWRAVHEKQLDDKTFLPFFKLIKSHANDNRNFVKKAVNWALRQMGKRSILLHEKALECAHHLLLMDDKSAHWIAKDAIKELESDKLIQRLQQRAINKKI